MAKIFETLTDRKGNIIPNVRVVAREALNPSGAVSQAMTDAFGNFEITVSLTATEFDIWVSEITEIDASNYIGRRISSGDSVSSFNLETDATWKVEHYGDDGVTGVHKATTHDSVTLRTGGFIETVDTHVEFRIGGAAETFRLTDIGDTVFFDPKLSGGNNAHIGLIEGSGAEVTNFYFGSAKARFINSDGDFDLNAGFFRGLVGFDERVTFSKRATFANTADEYPRLSAYAVPVNDQDLAPKKYIDDAIAAVPTVTDKIFEGDTSVEVVDIGVGQVVTTLDGTVCSVAVKVGGQGRFGFGESLFSPDELVHLKLADVSVGIKLQRTGTGEATSLFNETGIGSVSGTDFFFRSSGVDRGMINSGGLWGFGITSGLEEMVNIGGNVSIENYMRFKSLATPADPTNIDHAILFARAKTAKNNELVAKIKKNDVITEVAITSPEGICAVCGMEGSAHDPYFDTRNNKMLLKFMCGHTFEIPMVFKSLE